MVQMFTFQGLELRAMTYYFNIVDVFNTVRVFENIKKVFLFLEIERED